VLEHPGYARQKAVAWWTRRAPGLPVPGKVSEALQYADQLLCPTQIAVRAQGRYTEVVGVRFVQGGAS
jgi:DNA repair protein RadD